MDKENLPTSSNDKEEESISAPKPGDSEQILLMKYMTRLARQQRDLSEERSRLSADRTGMSEDRSRMSEDRSRMSEDRSRMSAERSEMSEMRSYLNAERTLSVWVRTALSMMVFGIAIDRFGLLLRQIPIAQSAHDVASQGLLNTISFGCGAALVALSIFMSLTTGIRYLRYARTWRQRHQLPFHHGPYLATFFAFMVAVFGVALLTIMFLFAE